MLTKEKKEQLEQEVDQYREKVFALQHRLDSITKVGNAQMLHKSLPFSESSCCSSTLYTFFYPI